MTREDVKKIFPDATDDQITSFLNQSNSDVAKEKAKNQKLKEDAEKAKALETELEELKQQNMTEAEKAELERQKEKAENEKRISDLEKALAESNRKALSSEITSAFANAGLSTETYASAIKAFASMPVDKTEDVMKEVKTFVDGISEANKAALDNAKSEWEKSVLDNTPNPGGGNPDKGQKKDDNDSPAAKYAKAYSARMNPKTEPADDNAPVNF
jgi:hypothetical protein